MAVPLDARITPISAIDTSAVSGQISPEQEAVIVNEALAPGNLVWGVKGVTKDLWQSLVLKGIQRGYDVNGAKKSDEALCFGLLSARRDPAWRYWELASHKGPGGGMDNERKVAIVLRKDAVMRAYPERVYAVGEVFHHPEIARGGMYFVESDNSVSGIPVKKHESRSGLRPWIEEVKIYPNDDAYVEPAITELWAGVVVGDRLFGKVLQEWTRELGFPLTVPLLNTSAELLASSIS